MKEKKSTIKIGNRTKLKLKKTAERLEGFGGENSKTYEDAIRALIEYYELTNNNSEERKENE